MPARERKQKSVRKGHVKIIVDEMYQRLQSKKHKKNMRNTNRILPPGGLRRAVIRKVFSFWVLEFYGKGRILTKKLATDVCCRLRKNWGLDTWRMRTKSHECMFFSKRPESANLGSSGIPALSCKPCHPWTSWRLSQCSLMIWQWKVARTDC